MKPKKLNVMLLQKRKEYCQQIVKGKSEGMWEGQKLTCMWNVISREVRNTIVTGFSSFNAQKIQFLVDKIMFWLNMKTKTYMVMAYLILLANCKAVCIYYRYYLMLTVTTVIWCIQFIMHYSLSFLHSFTILLHIKENFLWFYRRWTTATEMHKVFVASIDIQ